VGVRKLLRYHCGCVSIYVVRDKDLAVTVVISESIMPAGKLSKDLRKKSV
jgi:hypothetical protein